VEPIGRVAPEPWPFVRTMLTFDQLDSTSDRAAELVRSEAIDLPLCVRAIQQSRGRGRGDHSWWSDPGSLTFTLAIDPAAHGVRPESEPRLALSAAVAVIDALRDLGFDSPGLGIRWPNDIELHGRKLGGILPERVETEAGHRILIGIGVNVATDLGAAPSAVRAMATSLSVIGGPEVDSLTSDGLLRAILDRLASVAGQLAAGDVALGERWAAIDLLRDERVSVDLGDRIVAGRGCGIDADGALCLDQGGSVLRLFGGRVLR
jgi:BirA family transcriptional regulator, biotin operon repressor / biotin---[acetyl-CoA-carboxylase] ligase